MMPHAPKRKGHDGIDAATSDPIPEAPPSTATSSQSARRKRLAIVLFVATLLSTFIAGIYPLSAELGNELKLPTVIPQVVAAYGLPTVLANGFAYAIPVMLIWLAHEMGHFLQARRLGVPAPYPYFIPMPITPLGTIGAVIVHDDADDADRKQLFDIAISGPLVGLAVALPVCFFGLRTSEFRPVPSDTVDFVYGMPLLLEWMVQWIHGSEATGDNVVVNPIAFAGWVGILLTAVNLIPVGQLDGGHILYAMHGKRAHVVSILFLTAAIVYMLATKNLVFFLLIFILLITGLRHPPTRDDTVPLGAFRVILGWLTMAFLLIGLTPTPIERLPW